MIWRVSKDCLDRISAIRVTDPNWLWSWMADQFGVSFFGLFSVLNSGGDGACAIFFALLDGDGKFGSCGGCWRCQERQRRVFQGMRKRDIDFFSCF